MYWFSTLVLLNKTNKREQKGTKRTDKDKDKDTDKDTDTDTDTDMVTGEGTDTDTGEGTDITLTRGTLARGPSPLALALDIADLIQTYPFHTVPCRGEHRNL